MLPKFQRDAFQAVRSGTLALAALLPAERLDFSPGAGLMPLGELARHIVGADYYMLNRFFGLGLEVPDPIRDKKPLNGEQLAAHLSATAEIIRGLFAKLEASDLDEKKFLHPSRGELDYNYAVFHIIEHEIHHRSQLKLYLKLLGIDTSSVPL